jgi:hypothetical protein
MKHLCIILAVLLLIGGAMAMREFSDSGVPADVSKQLADYFVDAAKRLSKTIETPPGMTDNAKAYQRAFAAQRLQQVDAILRPLKVKATQWSTANIPAAAKEGLALAHKQAAEAGVAPKGGIVAGSFTVIDRATVQQFAMDTVSDLHRAADSMGDRTKHVLRRQAELGLGNAAINKILAGGVIEGHPTNTIRTLREELRKIHGDTVEINGKSFEVGYYAEMVARTKTRQATVQARHGRLEALGIDLVAIVGRLSDNFCSAFLGQVFSLSGDHPKYPALSSLPSGGPPFHPNCSKSTRPFVEELASDQQLEAAEGVDEADKLLGKSPADAQRAYKDLQLRGSIEEAYATTEKKLFG